MFKMRDFGFINDTHGFSKTKPYNVWKNMIRRCYNKSDSAFKIYGGAGVTVCDEWRLFSNYMKWYDENYIEGYEVDKDLGGLNEYSPTGCRFISKSENNGMIKDKAYYESSDTYRHHFKTICNKHGWRFEDFIEVKVGRTKSRHSVYNYFEIKGM